MTRYYLVKEVDGKIVRKTEIIHAEPRDTKGRYVSPNPEPRITAQSVNKARQCRCPRCGYAFLVV